MNPQAEVGYTFVLCITQPLIECRGPALDRMGMRGDSIYLVARGYEPHGHVINARWRAKQT